MSTHVDGVPILSERRNSTTPVTGEVVGLARPDTLKGEVMIRVSIDAGGRSYELGTRMIPGRDSINQVWFEDTIRHLIYFINEGTEVMVADELQLNVKRG